MPGEDHRVAGISGYTVRPARARREKPMVAAFTTAKIGELMALKPDLLVGFSDPQADLIREIIKKGVEVHVFNQRSVQWTLNMIFTLGAMVGASSRAQDLIASLERTMEEVRAKAATLSRRPVVYFEEWFDPLISGIKWVTALTEGLRQIQEIVMRWEAGSWSRSWFVVPRFSSLGPRSPSS